MKFAVNAVSSGARVGSLVLGELQLETPCLLLLTRKGLPAFITPDLLDALHPDASALQISPVHFVDNPSPSTVAAIGGAHKILSQPKRAIVAIARDSLGHETDGENSTKFGASFETPNGRRLVTPKIYMEAMNALKPNLWAALPDEVPAWATAKRNRVSVDRTLLWLDECLSLHAAIDDNILGVIVGGSTIDERKRSAQSTALRNVSGYSLGGFGLGENPEDRGSLLEAAITNLPADKIRHVSGLGMPEEVLHAVSHGVDLFDSTYPHMLTMGGFAMTFPFCMEEKNGYTRSDTSYEERADAGADSAKINLFSVTHRNDVSPIVKGCKCYACRKHTRAYIHHLLNVHEMLAQTLLDIHNYHHYLNFFQAIREAVAKDKFEKFRHWFISQRREIVLADSLKANKI
ncbi:unnamed protein product [Calypogeia fissa]